MVRVKWYLPHVKLVDSRTVEYNQPVYNWSKRTELPLSRSRNDSGYQDHGSEVAQMPDPAPAQVRVLPDFISGTPRTGWYDLLDSSQCLTSAIQMHKLTPLGYRMRTGFEAHTFFVVGRVISSFQTFTCPNHFCRYSRCYTLRLAPIP